MEELVSLAPSGSLGSGFDRAAFRRALDERPDFIGQDAGSTDMGPYYHGSGALFLPRASYKHDLGIMLEAAVEHRIPLIVGSVLTSGCRAQLAEGVSLVLEIAREKNLSFRMATINAELDKDDLKQRIHTVGPLEDLGPEAPLDDAMIDRCGPICAQMGVEPFIKALEEEADVIIAGRACDDAVFAALPIMRGFDKGLSLHMGKILECAGISCVPCDLAEPMVGRIRKDHFLVQPGSASHRCTTVSVAAHSMYERGNSRVQPGPGGINDLTDSSYMQVNDQTVEVRGSRFIPDERYRVKLEGAEFVGYRSVVIVGIRDAIMIRQIDDVLEAAREKAAVRFAAADHGKYSVEFHLYGKNAVMGKREPNTMAIPHEIGVLINVVAPTQELSNAIAMYVRGTLQHASYADIITTAGNLAYPFSPFNLPVGPAYRFSVYHLLPLEEPCSIFPIELLDVKN